MPQPREKKTITLRVQIDFRVKREVPADWTREQIEFLYNESSHCPVNEIQDLMDGVDRDTGLCAACFATKMSLVDDH